MSVVEESNVTEASTQDVKEEEEDETVSTELEQEEEEVLAQVVPASPKKETIEESVAVAVDQSTEDIVKPEENHDAQQSAEEVVAT